MEKEKEILLGQFCDLASVLSENEIEIARKHIIAYDSNTTGQSQKMFQLFREIVYKGTKNYDQLKENISKDTSEDSFNRLIRRTLYRFQESLIVEVNINRKGMYSELFKKRFEIRKRIMQAYIIHGKGLPKMANRIFDMIIKSTKAYELYDELIEALFLKQSVILIIRGKKSFEKINEDIEFYHQCRDLLQKTKNIYRTYSVEIYSKGIKESKIRYLKKSMKQVLLYYRKTGSANILSQFLLLKMEYCYILDNIEEEERTGLKLLDLLQNNKAVFSKPRISFVWNSLSNSMYASLNFEKSFQYIQESLKWFGKNLNVNYVIALQQQINSAFYLQDYHRAKEITKKAFGLSILKKYPYHESVIKYQNAMNHFAKEDFYEANKLLADLREIEKDKEGWNLWVRIMRILCSVEMLKLNLIDYDVENFRKYIQRIDRQYEVRKRDKQILSILIELDRNNFAFDKVAEKRSGVLAKLRSTQKQYKWDPKSPEMILFHDWFDAKLERRPYKPNFDTYRTTAINHQENKEEATLS